MPAPHLCLNINMFDDVVGEAAAAAQELPNSGGEVGCRARPSGGINTQSHVGCFQKKVGIKDFLFNFRG